MEAVFDAPMAAHGVGGGFGGEGRGGDVVAGVEATPILELGARGDLDDGSDAGQTEFAGEVFVAPEPIDLVRDRDRALLDPPMPFIQIGGGVETGGRGVPEEGLDLAAQRRLVGFDGEQIVGPASVMAVAMVALQAMASIVTVAPVKEPAAAKRSSRSGMAASSLDFSSTASWPRTSRPVVAKAETRCSGATPLPRS
jgi:hypothetical protein